MGEARRRGTTKADRAAALFKRHGAVHMAAERFNAYVAWTRSPILTEIASEIEFFSNEAETLIGVLVKHHTDRDFGFVLLGRDLKGRFRSIDFAWRGTKTTARHALLSSLQKHTLREEDVFPQGDEEVDKAGVDLFQTLKPLEQLHPSFVILRDQPYAAPARSIMSEMMRHFADVDGNFVEQFQTTGFDSRVWELYLYAALLELGLFVNKEHEAPDFEVRGHSGRIYIEAVISGPSPHDPPLELLPSGLPESRSPAKYMKLLKTRVPIRFGSALYSKLSRKKKYWEMAHVIGHPLVFAVADFHEDQSMTWTSPALTEYLYGVTHDFAFDAEGKLIVRPLEIATHEYQGKTIPSAFFFQKDAENVSAILFSSTGTVAKFMRMGMLAGFGYENQRMFRYGMKHRHDPNEIFPDYFSHEVKPGGVSEGWAEGLSMFHNPRASHPVNPSMFPGIAHHWFEGGQIVSLLPEFHVYSSMTMNIVSSGDQNAGLCAPPRGPSGGRVPKPKN